MAIYHLSADVVRRSAGRTATAAAAYRAGELILDQRTGLSFDYQRRRGVVHREILVANDAPAWARDRAQLWNRVEAAEKRKDAQLAREIEVAVPDELTSVQRLDLVRGFVRAAFVDTGMVADIALHAPGGQGDNRNHHAHILLTMRRIEGESFGAKERAWNAPALLEQWRALWADHINRALAQAGDRGRVDHRSLEAQGINRLAQIHLGPAVIEMQRRGTTTDRADCARAIAATNTRLSFAAARREVTGARQRLAAPKPPARAQSASTATQIAREAPDKISGTSALFRRFGRVLTVRIGKATTTPRRSGNTGGAFRKLAQRFSRRFADMRQDFKARASITSRGIRIDPRAYEAASLFLSDTLDQLNQLDNDTGSDSSFDEGFDNNENSISLSL
ncbi:MAG: MobQ family relaxase [Hyphomicrobium sp.]